jgi:uncharacterized protein (TIRG00374 family)
MTAPNVEEREAKRTVRSFLSRPSTAVMSWLGLGIAAAFAYFALRDVRFADVWHGLRASNYWWLIPAFAMLAVALVAKALRWRYLFARETRPDTGSVLSAMLIGYFFNSVLPARAGEAARVLALKRLAGTSPAEAGATVVLERAFDILLLLVLLFLAIPWLPRVTWLNAAVALAVAIAVGLALGIAVLAVWGLRPVHFALKPLHRLPFVSRERVEKIAADLGRGLAAVRQPKLLFAAIAWTTLSWLALTASTWFVMRGFHLGLSVVAALLVVVATNLVQIIPSSPAAVGVFEAATLVALRPYDVSDSRALSFALVAHALNFLPYVVVGPLLLRGTLRPESVETMRSMR